MLLRHGRTAGNAAKQYIGRLDQPLSPQGVEAAKQAGRDEGRRLVYVTPLIRTQQTARILFPNAEQVVVPDLREMDFGDFEGRSADDMADDPAYRAWVEGECWGPCPGGESMEGFSDRVCGCFETLLRNRSDREPCPAFVVHGGVIMALMARLASPAMAFYDAWTDNCQGYRCGVEFEPAFRLINPIRLLHV